MNEPVSEDQNNRRIELINKRHGGFTEEESTRPLTVPGWREECERRHAENLTPAEREELQQLQDALDQQLSAEFPRPFDEWEAALTELKELPED